MKTVIWKHPMYGIRLEYYTNLDTLFLTVGDTGYDLARGEAIDLVDALEKLMAENNLKGMSEEGEE